MIKALILVLLTAAVLPARADDLTVRDFKDMADIVKERCRVESHPSYDCNSSRIRELVVVTITGAAGASIARDVDEALRRGYAGELSLKDFFHGHLINRGPQTVFASFDAYLKNARTRLYHSAEYTERWGEEADRGLPAERRTPRSFVDLDEDGLVRAIDVIPPQTVLKGYERSGTIYSEDIVQARPGLTTLTYSDYGRNEPLKVTFCQDGPCRTCEVDTMFFILKSPNGAYQASNGDRFDLTLHCIDWLAD